MVKPSLHIQYPMQTMLKLGTPRSMSMRLIRELEYSEA